VTQVERLVYAIKLVTAFVVEHLDVKTAQAARVARDKMDEEALLTVVHVTIDYFHPEMDWRELKPWEREIYEAADRVDQKLETTIRQHREAIRRRLAA
jgi:hypothetical protein